MNKTSREFTTLATFYDCNLAIVNGLQIVANGTPQGMSARQREVVQEQIRHVWERLLDKIDLWRKSLSDLTAEGDPIRIDIRDQTLLGKPIGQLSLVRGFMLMREKCIGISEDSLCERLNLVDWDVSNAMWHGVLMNPNGRVMSGRATVNRACEFIAHLGGVELTDEEDSRLREQIYGEDWEQHPLPDPVA